jgi:predicted SprT family Zn-dependent metalloprotease
MIPSATQSLALQLMAQHGLADWSFGFNRRKRTLGLCWYRRQRIELSLHFTLANDEPLVRDTILHEIAHALAGEKAGHGPRWKALCTQIGCKPERCDRSAAMPPGRWRAACPGCGHEFSRHRRPRRDRTYACRTCGPGKGRIVFTPITATSQPVPRPRGP